MPHFGFLSWIQTSKSKENRNYHGRLRKNIIKIVSLKKCILTVIKLEFVLSHWISKTSFKRAYDGTATKRSWRNLFMEEIILLRVPKINTKLLNISLLKNSQRSYQFHLKCYLMPFCVLVRLSTRWSRYATSVLMYWRLQQPTKISRLSVFIK